MPDFSYILCFMSDKNIGCAINALREYVTKIIHSTRSVQNIPNLSNEAFVFTCIQRCTHGNGLMGHRDTNCIAAECKNPLACVTTFHLSTDI